MTKLLLILALCTLGACLASGQWIEKAPAKAATRVNPYAGLPDAEMAGGKLYAQHCATCHGKDRQGAGAAPALRSAAVENASEGQLFWLLTNGVIRHGMPSWSHLPPQQRWQIVTYLKSEAAPEAK